MSNNDYIIRATAAGQVRAFAAVTTDTVQEAQRRHETLPTATAAMGRVITAAVMMGNTLKGHETVTLRVLGDGPLGAVVAVADAQGAVRGYVQQPQVHLPIRQPDHKLDVGRAVGPNGMLHVTKNLAMREPYTGSVPLVSGEIGEDLAKYYLDSEQTPSAVSLGVLVDTDNTVRAAGGYIVQLLPDAAEGVVAKLEQNIDNMGAVSRSIDGGMSAVEMLEKVLAGFDLKINEPQPVEFACACSKGKLEGILISLGASEIEEMIKEEKGAEVRCHFCNEQYYFTDRELESLLQQSREE
ncbi:Hsp33 family molecular chaperone HslO [Metallumcola ferriviriculae]|uniref:33 kDa chaperonin n=1 Tax=Metallumcola ferriviriculae TaxID=3039180 RepID=A0AAU0UL04_9FIRM|nr:Hsp33 family molecular chaperone HslO [Desulfitibacteraceae bacterium MK1]